MVVMSPVGVPREDGVGRLEVQASCGLLEAWVEGLLFAWESLSSALVARSSSAMVIY